MERTYLMIKPDGVQRGIIGLIIHRFESRGLKLLGLKMMQATEEILAEHYAHLKDKSFFPSLLAYMTSGPVVGMVWEGSQAVSVCRTMLGPTNPCTANPGTIRGDFALISSKNVIHGSDSVENAEKEIQLWIPGKNAQK